MTRLGAIGSRLYRGEVSIDFVGRRRLWYLVSAVVLGICVLVVAFRGLNMGVEFTGGSVFQFSASNASVVEVRESVQEAGADEVIVQEVGEDGWRVQTAPLSAEEVTAVQQQIAADFGIEQGEVNPQSVGPSWGEQISQKALIALGVFLGLVILYLSIAFEWKVAVAAIAALAHDVVATIGVYSLVGFSVSPASVIGLLTILGYSLYDTVVVFDKVRENTVGLLGGARMTYSQAANLAVNQSVVRSINTSVTSLLPVGAILFIGAGLLGAGTLKDLALVLFVGMMVGTYSSLFLATPLLAELKEREPQFQALARRVAARQGGAKSATRRARRRPEPAPDEVGNAPPERSQEGAADEQAAETPETGSEPAPAQREAVGVAPQQRQEQHGPRQQPRRTSKAKRRPSGKKRR